MENNDNLTKLVSIAERLLSELELITASTKAKALLEFQSETFTTDQRRKIYNFFDGERDSQAIADEVGCTSRAVQLFIKELQEKDLISVEKRGRAIIPCKSISKIATYYATQEIIKAEENTL